MTPAKPLARYGAIQGARFASGFAPATYTTPGDTTCAMTDGSPVERRRRPSTYSADRPARHPETRITGRRGLMRADVYSGLNRLFEADRRQLPPR